MNRRNPNRRTGLVARAEENNMSTPEFADREPTRAEVDQMPGPVVLEFGASWWGYCQALQPQLAALLERLPGVRHIWVEDGKGKPLGRSFRVKLWPTLVFLHDGQVVQQTARPDTGAVVEGLRAIAAGA
jgi:thioredoxin 1